MKSVSKITIHGYHIDHFGHLNHSRVVELLEEARWRYLEENQLIDVIHKAGAIHVVARIEVDYRHPARAMDLLRFETGVAGRSDHGFCMEQDILLDASDKLVVQAKVFNVFVDLTGGKKAIDEGMLAIWPDLAEAATTAY